MALSRRTRRPPDASPPRAIHPRRHLPRRRHHLPAARSSSPRPASTASPRCRSCTRAESSPRARIDRAPDAREVTAFNADLIPALGLASGVTHAEYIRSARTAASTSSRSPLASAEPSSPMSSSMPPASILGPNGLASKSPCPRRALRPAARCTEYAGSVLCLARNRARHFHFDAPEIVFRMKKHHHAGLIVRSAEAERVRLSSKTTPSASPSNISPSRLRPEAHRLIYGKNRQEPALTYRKASPATSVSWLLFLFLCHRSVHQFFAFCWRPSQPQRSRRNRLQPIGYCSGQFCRYHGQGWSAFPGPRLAHHQKISLGDHGLRRCALRLRQRRPARHLFRQRRAAHRSHRQRHHPAKDRPRVLEPPLSPEERRHL